MPAWTIDRMENLSLVERHGVITSMVRKARVTYMREESPPKGYPILREALIFLGTQGYTAMSDLAREGFESLVLVERAPTIAENDPKVVDVVLKYEHVLQGPNQQLTAPGRGIIYGKGRCSISEKTTNFYWPPGTERTPENRVQILVSHTFPEWDMGVVGQAINPDLPFTIVQGGDVNVPFPQANFQVQGVRTTQAPWADAFQFIARINADPWCSKPARTWICSEVQWEVLDTSLHTYRFGFEFQYNVDTWRPTVVFNDQRTGRPPAGVKFATHSSGGVMNMVQNPYVVQEGVDAANNIVFNPVLQPAGMWQVPLLEEVDFNRMFQAMFEGPQLPGVN